MSNIRDRRSLFHFAILVVVSVGATVFVLAQAGKAIAELEVLSRTPALSARRSIAADGQDISTWKTYRNEEYGFEVRYPADKFIEKPTDQAIPPTYGKKYHGMELVWFGKTYYQNENLKIDFVPVDEVYKRIRLSIISDGTFSESLTQTRIAQRESFSISFGDEGGGVYYYFVPLDSTRTLMIVRSGLWLPEMPHPPDLKEQDELFRQIILTVVFHPSS